MSISNRLHKKLSMETNIKLITHGSALHLWSRVIELDSFPLNPKQVQTICTLLTNSGIPATPYGKRDDKQRILIPAPYQLRKKDFKIDTWAIELKELDETLKLSFQNPLHRQKMSDLYKRRLKYQVDQRTNLWTLKNTSNRMFYHESPIELNSRRNNDFNISHIDGYRRLELSEIIIDYAGIGFPVDVGTAFFTNLSILEFFELGHAKEFYEITGYYRENKGTLIFKGYDANRTCYFENFKEGVTLGNAPKVVIDHTVYDNPYEYYKQKHPHSDVSPHDRAVLVSFRNMDTPVYLPAKRVYARVMNEYLPFHLKNIDKIKPPERKRLINDFWRGLGDNPFGRGFSNINRQFFTPPSNQMGIIDMPNIIFGQGGKKTLIKPKVKNKESYRSHFRMRKNFLEENGCFFVPRNMKREIYIAYDENGVSEKTIDDLSSHLKSKIEKVTGKTVKVIPFPYDDYSSIISELASATDPQMVVFIFNNRSGEPAIYFDISSNLKKWRLKRITERQLNKQHRRLLESGNNYDSKEFRDWNGFVRMNSLDIIQQLGCIPFVPNTDSLDYDSQLVIDVSEKHSHFTLSLFVFKEGMSAPIFDTLTERKSEKKKETINKEILKKYLKQLLMKHADTFKQVLLDSMLVMRDGKNCDDEYEAIKEVLMELRNEVFSQRFVYDYIEYRKSSLKEVRIWDKDGRYINNVLEGSFFKTSDNEAFLATTGDGSLRQGTANLIAVTSVFTDPDINKVLRYIFVTSQLNFSSPSVAQRLTLPAKRADEELKDKRKQEVVI